jgi:hypothetical protein
MSAILKELSDSNAKRSSNSSVKIDGEEFQRISDYHKLPPFFISIVSATDFWMFVSSRGSLTAGRVSPENALFPYKPDDQIHDSWAHTGPVAIFKIADNTKEYIWRPFEDSVSSKYLITRNLYKNKLGTTLVFEEINEDLQVRYQYKLSIASEFGLVMGCNLSSNSEKKLSVNMLCGYQNILPAGVPRSLQ